MNTTPALPRIGGLTPFTTTDYPGHISAVIFLQGCPWRCHYCHNPPLQIKTTTQPVDWPTLTVWLQKRQGLLDAVVFSGGEPCADPGLYDAMQVVKSLGFKIGLHTAGAYPRRLKTILPLLDWVGLDIKAPFKDYDTIIGVPYRGQPVRISAEAILNAGLPYEFRTTLHATLLNETQLWLLANQLALWGVQQYAWQLFRPIGCNTMTLIKASQIGYPNPRLVEQVSQLFPYFTLRRTFL